MSPWAAEPREVSTVRGAGAVGAAAAGLAMARATGRAATPRAGKRKASRRQRRPRERVASLVRRLGMGSRPCWERDSDRGLFERAKAVRPNALPTGRRYYRKSIDFMGWPAVRRP